MRNENIKCAHSLLGERVGETHRHYRDQNDNRNTHRVGGIRTEGETMDKEVTTALWILTIFILKGKSQEGGSHGGAFKTT